MSDDSALQKFCDATAEGGWTCDIDFKHGIVHSCVIDGRRFFWGHKQDAQNLVMSDLARNIGLRICE